MNFFRNFSTPLGEIFAGNLLLLFCSLFYLAWWAASFKPGSSRRPGGAYYITAAFVSGIAAIFFVFSGIAALSSESAAFPIRYIILSGVLIFIVMLPVTSRILKRPVTSELFIMHFWTVLEFSMAEVLSGTGNLSFVYKQILVIMIAVTAMISLGCYMIYYRLDDSSRFRVGMMPLGMACFMAIAFLAGLALTHA